MWLLPSQLRSPSSASPPEPLGSSSGCGSPDCGHAWWPVSSAIPTPRPCSWRGWKTRPWSQRLFGAATWNSSMPDHLREWVSSLLDTPAPQCPPQASDSASETPDGSGPRSQESSLSAGLHTSSSKTSVAIVSSPSTMFGLAWGQWATSVRQVFSRRRKLARRTNANASSSWPTPNAVDSTQRMYQAENHAPVDSLPGAARNWPTPSASVVSDGEPVEKWEARRASLEAKGVNGNGAGMPLTIAARSWPTPAARDVKGSDLPRRNSSPSLPETVQNWPADGESSAISLLRRMILRHGHDCSPECLRLNPQFVNWLNGLPPGWTDSESSAMEWFPLWLRMHSERLRAVWESQRILG